MQYSRLISSLVERTRRVAANWRELGSSPASWYRKSRSRETMILVFSFERLSTSRIGLPKAILVPSMAPVASAGEYETHAAFGNRSRSFLIAAWRVGLDCLSQTNARPVPLPASY